MVVAERAIKINNGLFPLWTILIKYPISTNDSVLAEQAKKGPGRRGPARMRSAAVDTQDTASISPEMGTELLVNTSRAMLEVVEDKVPLLQGVSSKLFDCPDWVMLYQTVLNAKTGNFISTLTPEKALIIMSAANIGSVVLTNVQIAKEKKLLAEQQSAHTGRPQQQTNKQEPATSTSKGISSSEWANVWKQT